tara:strand:+ start:3634 stop:3882 length:249 start_codon:yes stop_codon:yes gene_type:complete
MKVTNYDKKIKTVYGPDGEAIDVYVDIYDVLNAWDIRCPGMQQAVKKSLMAGHRGVKSADQDKDEAILAIKRSIKLEKFNHE